MKYRNLHTPSSTCIQLHAPLFFFWSFSFFSNTFNSAAFRSNFSFRAWEVGAHFWNFQDEAAAHEVTREVIIFSIAAVPSSEIVAGKNIVGGSNEKTNVNPRKVLTQSFSEAKKIIILSE